LQKLVTVAVPSAIGALPIKTSQSQNSATGISDRREEVDLLLIGRACISTRSGSGALAASQVGFNLAPGDQVEIASGAKGPSGTWVVPGWTSLRCVEPRCFFLGIRPLADTGDCVGTDLP
jgi:hypothetical protein